MQAPTLSQNQLKKALKKKVIKRSIRNVLSKPMTLIWPEITVAESEEILTDIKQYLTFKPNKRISWELIKNTPKNNRKELRKNLRPIDERKSEMLNHVVFGINVITKGLEKNIISCILITSDVNPQEMVRHICYLCNNLKIPILVVPNLREEMKSIIGFSTIALGFKNIPNKSPLHKTYKLICKLSDKFSTGQYSIQNVEGEDLFKNNSEQNVNNNDTEINMDANVYIYRDTTDRVFKPSENENIKKSLNWNSDFIEINDGSIENDHKTTNARTSDTENSYVQGVPILQQLIYSDQVPTQNQNTLKNKCNTKNGKDITLKPLDKIISKVDKRTNYKRKSNKNIYIPVKIKRLQSNPKRKRNSKTNK